MTRLLPLLIALLVAFPTLADDKLPKLLSIEPSKPAAGDSELKKLMKERYAEVWREMVLMHKAMQTGQGERGGSNSWFNAAGRLVSSYLALEPTAAEKLSMLTNYVDMAKNYEALQKARFEAGTVQRQELHRATYFRLDAEIQLAKAAK